MTQQEINDFKATIYYQQTIVGNAMTKVLQISGRQANEVYLIKFKLINCYANILLSYFSQTDYSNNNFFTTDEILEVLFHFNNLCNTNYNLNL